MQRECNELDSISKKARIVWDRALDFTVDV